MTKAWLIAVVLALGVCACVADERQEDRLCSELSPKLCEKWFDCFPVVSARIFGNENACEGIVQTNCSSSEFLFDCDLDNSDLNECNQQVEGTACGQLPESCRKMAECE